MACLNFVFNQSSVSVACCVCPAPQARVVEKVRSMYTNDPDFTPANAAKASSAAEGLCKWVHAMDSYDKVAKVVAPKRRDLQAAEAEYAAVMEGLSTKQAELSRLMEQLAQLEAQLQVRAAYRCIVRPQKVLQFGVLAPQGSCATATVI